MSEGECRKQGTIADQCSVLSQQQMPVVPAVQRPGPGEIVAYRYSTRNSRLSRVQCAQRQDSALSIEHRALTVPNGDESKLAAEKSW